MLKVGHTIAGLARQASARRAWRLAITCLLAPIALTSAASARRGATPIALTFDDLPGLTIERDQDYVDRLNADLLAALRRHRWPATGFVNAGKIDELARDRQIANLERWLAAGMTLGNHTYAHIAPAKLGARGYIADIARGEPVLRQLLGPRGQTLRWFRHPYLETGYPGAVKRAINAWLARHGYRVAPVTVDADDWEFAEPYDDALVRGDRPLARRIMRAYLSHTAMRLRWSQRSARVLFGREIAQVMLLHDTRLDADALEALAGLFGRRHLRVVTLEAAMRDPAYCTRDRYVGRDGPTWLERWAVSRGRSLPEQGDEDPPHWIAQAYDRVDSDRQ